MSPPGFLLDNPLIPLTSEEFANGWTPSLAKGKSVPIAEVVRALASSKGTSSESESSFITQRAPPPRRSAFNILTLSLNYFADGTNFPDEIDHNTSAGSAGTSQDRCRFCLSPITLFAVKGRFGLWALACVVPNTKELD
mmetsp:Transcript_45239/g.94895  ORF Transcript_45239/g.94895 Transcript_45239/m.94895 type:complete len:139 (+) Transcript_45239:4443-4859(+)